MVSRTLPSLLVVVLAIASCREPDTSRPLAELMVVGQGTGKGASRDVVVDLGEAWFGGELRASIEVRNAGRGVLGLETLEVVQGDVTVISELPESERPSPLVVAFSPTEVPSAGTTTLDVLFSPGLFEDARKEFTAVLRLNATGTAENEASATIRLVAWGVAQGCEAPMGLDFGPVEVDGTRELELRFPNHSALARVPGDASLQSETGDHEAFTTSFEDKAVAPGEERIVRVRFRPTEDREFMAYAMVRGFADCNPRKVELRGRGTYDLLVWEPAHDFGFVPVGLEASAVVWIRNRGHVDVEVGEFSFKDDESFGFVVGKEPRAVIVPAGGERTLAVACRPVTPGLHEGVLDFRTSLRVQPAGRVQLRCTGGGPDIDVVPAQLNFGEVAVVSGASPPLHQSRRLVLMNKGTAASVPPDSAENLHLGTDGQEPWFSIRPANANTRADEFQVILDGPYSPAHGMSARLGSNLLPLQVRLTPETVGPKHAVLTVHSNDLDEPAFDVPILATAEEYPPCSFSLSRTQLDFGLVSSLETRELEFELANNGTLTGQVCLVSALELTPDTSPYFELVGGPIPSLKLQPGDSMRIRVRAAPTGGVPETPVEVGGAVQFFINDPDAPEVKVRLSMQHGGSCLLTLPAELDFQAVKVGCERQLQFELRNICESDILVTGIQFEPPVGSFTLESVPVVPPGGIKLAPTVDAVPIIIRFAPVQPVEEAALLRVDLKAVGTTSARSRLIPVRGEGVVTGLRTDSYTQGGGKVDIVFGVTDWYGHFKQVFVPQDRLPPFVQYLLDAQVDFRIGVTAFYTGYRWFDEDYQEVPYVPGTLVAGSTHPERYLVPGTPGLIQKLQAKLLFVDAYSPWVDGSGVASVIYAASEPLVSTLNLGFIRSDARFAPVLLSYYHEITSPRPEDRLVDLMETYQKLLEIKGSARKSDLVFSGFYGDLPSTHPICGIDWSIGMMANPFYSYLRYNWLASMTGGMTGNSCPHANEAQEMEELAQTVSGFRRWFPLSDTPDLSQGSIEVRVDGSLLPPTDDSGQTLWTYEPAKNRIAFASVQVAPPKGSQVEITYPVACQ